MGKNRLVYGENTEILYLINILMGMMAICGGIGVLLILLGQTVFGCIGFGAAVIIAIIILCEKRKQYQKIDGSFLYDGKELSIHVDLYGKMRVKKPVVIKYGEKEIPMHLCEGGKFVKTLVFMLNDNTPCVFEVNRKKQGVDVKIGEETVVDNNYVRKDYLLQD